MPEMTAAGEERRVTAVVVNYNGGDLLGECVGALLSGPVVEKVVVIDNASRDDSLATLERCFDSEAKLEILRNESNVGYAAAVNRGLARTATEFALIINPDCVAGAGMLRSLMAEADATERAAVCGGVVVSSDGVLQAATRRRYPAPRRTLRRALGWPARWNRWYHPTEDFDRSGDPLPPGPEDVYAVSGALMLVRMAAVREVGEMDEGYFLHCEDLDWCVRFRRAGWQVRFVPEGFAVHVKGTSGGGRPWRVQWHLHRGMARFYRKFESPSRGPLFTAGILAAITLRFLLITLVQPLRARVGRSPDPSSALTSVREMARRIEAFEPPGGLVIGGTSAVASYLLEDFQGSADWWLAVSRREAPLRLDDGVVRMQSVDGANLPGWARERLRHVVHVAPLWTLVPYLENLRDAPIERVVACSSTSVVTKRNSKDASERAVASRLAEAEAAVRAHCEARGIELVLLRPTLIYAPGCDRNLDRIARFVRRVGVFPVAGGGNGLRQPVHAQDVAGAIRASLERPEAAGRCYTVSGAEALTYREMVERIFRAAGRRPRIVRIPVGPYRLALRSIAWLSRGRGVRPEAADRMDSDLSFDHEAAERDLGFRPRAFLETR